MLFFLIQAKETTQVHKEMLDFLIFLNINLL